MGEVYDSGLTSPSTSDFSERLNGSMKGFLEYVPGNSPIHRLDPRSKLLIPLLLCVGCFASSHMLFLLALLCAELLLGAVGGIWSRTVHIFLGLVKIMLFLFVLQVLFTQRGNTLFPLLFGLRVTDQGVWNALLVALRLICATLPLSILLSLTKMSDLSNSLVGRCHIPYKYAFAVTSAINFIPAFSSDMGEIMEAQTARGVEFDTKNVIKKLKLIFPLCVPLLISSAKKTDSTAMSAELRGFHLRKAENCYRLHAFTYLDAIALLLALAVMVGGILL